MIVIRDDFPPMWDAILQGAVLADPASPASDYISEISVCLRNYYIRSPNT